MSSKQRSYSTMNPLRHDDAKAAITDALSVMMKQERTTYACHDYLTAPKTHQASSNTPKITITTSDRQRVIDWCYDIIDQCHLNRETMAVAMNLADRFMCTQTKRSNEILYHRGQYQLLIVTALYVAVKMNEPILFSSADFAAVTHDTYTATELEAMEQTLLTTLEWRCCVPTAQQIGMHILELLKLHLLASEIIRPSSSTWEFLEEELAFQTQTALRDYFFTTERSSTVAAISMLNAIEQVNDIEYEPLMRMLISKVLKKFEFEEASTLLYSRHRLRSLVVAEDNDCDLCDSERSCESDEALIEDEDHQQEDDEVSLERMSLEEQEVEEVDPQDCFCYTQDQAEARAAAASLKIKKDAYDTNTCKISVVTESTRSSFSCRVRALDNDDCSIATAHGC